MNLDTPLAAHLSEPTRIGDEISITGKWVPTNAGGRFRSSEESCDMLAEWEDIHEGARSDSGVLSTEINHAVGEDAVLVHHVFESPEALVHYFDTTATAHLTALTAVARPDLHLVRGTSLSADVLGAVRAKTSNVAFGEHLFGFVKHDYRLPDPATAINVTAKWTAKSAGTKDFDELVHWWQQVATDAYDLEEGMVRFEAYRVIGEEALDLGAAHYL